MQHVAIRSYQYTEYSYVYNNRPFHLTLEGIRLRVNEIASFSGVPWEAIFGVKFIELTGFFSAFEASLYHNYVKFSNKPNSIIRAIFILLDSLTICMSDVRLQSYSA